MELRNCQDVVEGAGVELAEVDQMEVVGLLAEVAQVEYIETVA